MASSSVISFVPPFRFSTVEAHLYRGAYPTLKNMRFLRTLRLHTIISIIPEPPTSDLADFCRHEGIRQHVFHADKFTSDNVTISPSIVVEILYLILQLAADDQRRVYVHCLDGANVTGIVMMLLRKLQNWKPAVITSEFCRFTRDHVIEKEELEFFERFTKELRIPESQPKWLWHGIFVLKHPCMKISIDGHEEQQVEPKRKTNSKWDTEQDKTSIILKQLEDRNALFRTRIAKRNHVDATQDDEEEEEMDRSMMEMRCSRTLQALDLAYSSKFQIGNSRDFSSDKKWK